MCGTLLTDLNPNRSDTAQAAYNLVRCLGAGAFIAALEPLVMAPHHSRAQMADHRLSKGIIVQDEVDPQSSGRACGYSKWMSEAIFAHVHNHTDMNASRPTKDALTSHDMQSEPQPEARPTASTLTATAMAYLKVFKTLDPDTIAPIQADNYKHTFAPASLHPPGPFTRETFAHHLTQTRELLRSFPVRVKQLWPNPSLNQVIVWSDSETEFHEHVKDSNGDGDGDEWKYRGEYMWLLAMDKNGEKVEHVLEFLDSKGTDQLRALMVRARKRKEEVEGHGHGRMEGGWDM
ncbi:Uu.00g067590.m01.CDS01 [Anthostomella pinea]|uniref:Uu.00g067590.m01.CDS01 n=1 Tax=Anthostomella pinea TaxID=933095 RepID=A0AAI8YN98_9PEZI|nr:Uu.00g067590.m01.CDS01 [Anthostomella pinea]